MAACIVAWPAVALSTRPDRADAVYRELASKYPSSIASSASGSEAVLISPRWLLTAGAAAQSQSGTDHNFPDSGKAKR
jgi:hypothetical protein